MRNTNRPTTRPTTKPTLLRQYQSARKGDSSKQQPSQRIHADLITFDLDDTLFPVAPVLQDANEALVQRMTRVGYEHISVEGIIDSTKYIRAALKVSGEEITFTELRKRAIQREMDKQRPPNSTKADGDDDNTASQFYERWERERHTSAERNLYPDAIPMLQKLRMDHPSVVIGAITNGRGNPFEMTSSTLSEYFDFCISGEDSEVFPLRKPHIGIYKIALQKYREMVIPVKNNIGIIEGGENLIEENGCNWFHVGDDLANDVGASAACGAAAIWVDLLEAYGQTSKKRVSVNSSKQPSWSTASKEELDKRRIVGEKARESITARIERLSDLPDAILRTLEVV